MGLSPLSTVTSYSATSVLPGQLYHMRVAAKNKYGWSSYSASLAIYAAAVPEAPAAPTTARNSLDMRISWVAPDNNGLAVTAYEILILQKDGVTWAAHTATCDGASAAIVS
jgi:hypothetical protein